MLGVDVVDIERLRDALASHDGLAERLFTERERTYCASKPDPAVSYAGTLAAKEAVMKALYLSSLPAWARRIEIRRENGVPHAITGATTIPVSISHDGGVAVAVAFHGEPAG